MQLTAPTDHHPPLECVQGTSRFNLHHFLADTMGGNTLKKPKDSPPGMRLVNAGGR
jgi:hypothetical protein